MSYLELKPPLDVEGARYSSNDAKVGIDYRFLQRTKIRGAVYAALLMMLCDIAAFIASFMAIELYTDINLVNFQAFPQFFGTISDQYSQNTIVLACLSVAVFAYGGLYSPSSWDVREFQRIAGGTAVVAAVTALLVAAVPDGHVSWPQLSAAFLLFAVLAIVFRMCLRGLPGVMPMMGSHVIMVGGHDALQDFITQSKDSRSNPIYPLAHLSFEDLGLADDLSAVADLDLMARQIAEQRGLAKEDVRVLLAPRLEEVPVAEKLMALLDATDLHISMLHPSVGLSRKGLCVRQSIGADLILTESGPMTVSLAMQVVKRLFDIVLGTFALILCTPFLLCITILLAFEKGPILYVQKRVGHGGRRFDCLKFRSMRPDAQEVLEEMLANDPDARAEWAKHQKLTNDPRVTLTGKILRKTSLDELPQLFNVLRGDMSLVGPRPIIAPEIPGYLGDRNYYEDPSFLYYARCKPGITGLWQVSGRASTVHEERVRLDRWYARNFSIWLDLCILFQTVRVVVTGKGSG